MNDPAIFGYGFAAAAFLAFAVHLGLGWRGGAKASILLGVVVASAASATATLAFSLTGLAALWRLQAVLDALRAGGWILFLCVVLQGTRYGLRAAALPVALPILAWLFYPSGFHASRLAFGVLLAVPVAGLALTEQLFRQTLPSARWAVKPLCLGLGAGFMFDVYLFADALLFGRIDGGVWAARGFVQALVIPFVAIATVRNRQWSIDLALSRGVLFHSTAFLGCGLYLLAVAAAGYYVRYFGGSWGKTLQVGFVFAALLVLAGLFSSGTLRSRLRVFINKHFFSYRYDYRHEWLRFTNLLSSTDAGANPAQRSIQALANLVESPGGAIWLQSEATGYAQAARWNMPALDAREPGHSPFAAFLAKTGWVVDLEQRRPAGTVDLPAWLRELPAAWLVVPVIAQEELTGFAILATPRARIELNWEVRDLLKTAARQVGSFLAQVQASEALLEARKFESFNRMTAFVVHDLKNLVAQLSLLLRNAARHRHNPRFQDDMLTTVRHVEERMNRLLAQLATGSRSEENLRPIPLARVIERVVAAKKAARADIAVHASDAALAAVGYEQRFERVLGHLVQNAIDATQPSGEVRISVAAEGDDAVIEIADSGCGMSEAFVRERLFRPFQTTKGNGMGIGVFEVAQYARDMGGRVEVDSRPGAGTRFRLMFPLQRDGAMAA
ncbi:MAG TPA: XrtA/PEP-CTERM system histidine kinase PrsK [Burkholderiales bacterium]